MLATLSGAAPSGLLFSVAGDEDEAAEASSEGEDIFEEWEEPTDEDAEIVSADDAEDEAADEADEQDEQGDQGQQQA